MQLKLLFSKLASKPAIIACLAVGLIGWIAYDQFFVYAPDEGQIGGPIAGLSPQLLRKFYKTRETFKHEFTPEEGLGPLFNGKSCFECHGQPGVVGAEGRDVVSTGVVRIGRRIKTSPYFDKPLEEVAHKLTRKDVYLQFEKGGPALSRKSITSEFPDKYPAECQVEIGSVPPGTDLISMRHAGPLFGAGLIEAIPDADIFNNVLEQSKVNAKLAGRALSQANILTEGFRIGRFGWKNQHGDLLNFTAEAMNVEMGLTTYSQSFEKSSVGISVFPTCILKFLPPEPNDTGKVQAELSFFQALLAPPPRGEITLAVERGEKLFEKLQCAVCHKPEMRTAPVVYVVDPDSPFPRFEYVQVPALENKPVRAYSDFLLHNMGPELADGVPQAGANGGEWRTTPLWGLRFKRFYLHDGRTTDLTKAILAHGGQAEEVKQNFASLPDKDKQDLLAFLRSL